MKLIQAISVFILIESNILNLNAEMSASDVSTKSDNICLNDKCIMKCCAFEKYIHKVMFLGKDGGLKRKTTCDNLNETKTNLDKEFDNVFIRKPNISMFEIKPGLFKVNKTFRVNSLDVTVPGFNLYLDKHSKLSLEIRNAFDRWIRIPNNLYCIDFVIEEDLRFGSRTDLKPGIWTLYVELPTEINRPNTIVMIVGMLVSCVFLALVLVVYGLLPELRNLCGLILMAYVASQLGAFLLLVVMRIKVHEESVCEGLTYVIYFFFLASFCWMNVMSYDIWWTFRGYAKARPIHRRGERFKFVMYCLYAFGLPLGMTVGLAVLNKMDLKHTPWFVTPKIPGTSCFIKEGEKLLYLYVPMLILILCNWLLYILTAVNIWRLSRGTGVLDSKVTSTSQARRLNRRRFIIYLKLSVVMGLNWLLELMSYTSAGEVVWFISDCYNMLIGVAVFGIFVCKRKIWRKLRHRFACKNSKWYPAQEDASKTATSTENTSTATHEANTVPLMCYTGTSDGQQPEIIVK